MPDAPSLEKEKRSAEPPVKRAHPPRTSRGSDPDKALYGLLFFIVFALGCWFLVRELRRDSAIQDCVMAGHRNCDPDVLPVPDR